MLTGRIEPLPAACFDIISLEPVTISFKVSTPAPWGPSSEPAGAFGFKSPKRA